MKIKLPFIVHKFLCGVNGIFSFNDPLQSKASTLVKDKMQKHYPNQNFAHLEKKKATKPLFARKINALEQIQYKKNNNPEAVCA
tara:strand:+ start:919 stop:1170 length:252 start_codon:yes stop_codon:yes gene_type:complete